MGSDVGQAHAGESIPKNLSDGRSIGPRLSRQTLRGKAPILVRQHGGLGKQRIIGTVELLGCQMVDPFAKDRCDVLSNWEEERLYRFRGLGLDFTRVLEHAAA